LYALIVVARSEDVEECQVVVSGWQAVRDAAADVVDNDGKVGLVVLLPLDHLGLLPFPHDVRPWASISQWILDHVAYQPGLGPVL
jgi:hypothetical protein